MDYKEKLDVVYTSFSKHNYFAKNIISSFVLENNKVPLNPFTNWGYFMNDMVDRGLTRRANNNLIYLSNELWQFGIISNGCYHETKLAIENGLRIRFFNIGKDTKDFKELNVDELEFEKDLEEEYDINQFKNDVLAYLNRGDENG